MLKKLALTAVMAVLPSVALADETVQPHLFDDLNGNGISDASEHLPGQELQGDREIDEEILPDTPPDETTAPREADEDGLHDAPLPDPEL